MPLGATVLVRGARTQNAFKKMIQYNADLGQWTALEPAEAAKVKSDCYELNYDLDTRSHQKLRKYLEMREFERKAYVNLIAGPTLERIRMAREAAEEEAAG